MRRKLTQHKLLQQVARSIEAYAGQPIRDSQSRTLAAAGGIVKVRETCGAEVAQNPRVARLPAPVISTNDDRRRQGIARPRPEAAGAFVAVSRILPEEDR